MAHHAPAASAAPSRFPSAAERDARAAFARYQDADPAHGPLLTGSAARARTPTAPSARPARKAVAV